MEKVWEVKEVLGAYVANQHLQEPHWTLLQVYTKPRMDIFSEPRSGEVDVMYVLGRTEAKSWELRTAATKVAMN